MTESAPVFVLLTDFGLTDPYVGQLKATLFSRAPTVPVLDLSHGVPPFSVPTGAFFLAVSRKFYPKGSIFICVVDPGVGSSRDLLCITNGEHTLLGPDNGLLALAYGDMLREGPVSVYALTRSAEDAETTAEAGKTHKSAATGNPPAGMADGFFPGAYPNTFHGRDILAPAAAALALGSAPGDIGARLRDVIAVPPWAEAEHDSGEICCTVLHVDRFGNVILNLPNGDDRLLYPRLSLFIPRSGGNVILHQASHYAGLPTDSPGLIPGGQGYYELALANKSAAVRLGLAPGDECRIRGDLWREA